jgi:uncharacterized membrane protein YgdD (TMEM256/DUF423 family)
LKQTSEQAQRSPALTILLVIAAFMGAAGITLAAAAAHAVPGAGLGAAASMLLFHAAATLGAAALAHQGLLRRSLGLSVIAAWVIGAVLFSGDIALRAFAEHRLFPMAAPAGGIILIFGWLVLALAVLGAPRRA